MFYYFLNLSMYKYFLYSTIISLLLFCLQCNDPPLESSTGNTYNVGDILADEHLELEFNYCYPLCGSSAPDDCVDYTENTFSFLANSGKVFMIEMSATW